METSLKIRRKSRVEGWRRLQNDVVLHFTSTTMILPTRFETFSVPDFSCKNTRAAAIWYRAESTPFIGDQTLATTSWSGECSLRHLPTALAKQPHPCGPTWKRRMETKITSSIDRLGEEASGLLYLYLESVKVCWCQGILYYPTNCH